MVTMTEASAVDIRDAEQPLWNVKTERNLLEESMLAPIYCDKCNFAEKAFFKRKSAKCPRCKVGLKIGNSNERNAVVGNKTEGFALRLLETVTKELCSELEQELFAKRQVICPELGFKRKSAADLAILSQDLNGLVPASAIKCLFEVKMSFIWNWHEDDLSQPTSDYDGSHGRPSIYRTDSILKAIGKASITRNYPGGERIPFIVIGNTPPPTGYRASVDKTVSSGLIQKWISLTPKPLVVNRKDTAGKRNPKSTPGFLRIDEVKELQQLLKTLLTKQWLYTSAMVEAEKVGTLIKTLDLNRTPEQVGQEFLRRLPEASISSDI